MYIFYMYKENAKETLRNIFYKRGRSALVKYIPVIYFKYNVNVNFIFLLQFIIYECLENS